MVFLLLTCISVGNAADTKPKDILLNTMQQELQRATTELGKLTPAPYFLSYEVRDQNYAIAVGSDGVLLSSVRTRRRAADVITHVGTPALDNSHENSRRSAIHSGALAIDDDPDAIARELWRATYQGYRNAAKAYLNVKTQTAVNTKEEDTSADFSQEKPQVHLDYKTPVPLPDQARSEARGPEQRETGISVATIGKVVSGFRSILWRGTGKTEPAPKPAFRRTF